MIKISSLLLEREDFGQTCGVHYFECFQFIYNYAIKNIFCILKTSPAVFQILFWTRKIGYNFSKVVFREHQSNNKSNVGPTILWIAKQKTIFKYSYQIGLYIFIFKSSNLSNCNFSISIFKHRVKKKNFLVGLCFPSFIKKKVIFFLNFYSSINMCP